MKSSPIGLAKIADLNALAAAFHAAARGKCGRPEVEAFRDDLHRGLARLRERVMDGAWTPAPMRAFSIRDPKPRLIHAPAFADRVLHHALMAQVGPVLDRSLVFDTYACRVGKGTLAAVRRAAEHAARHPWCARIDVRAYFASIDHGVLLGMLDRRFRSRDLMGLFARLLAAHHSAPELESGSEDPFLNRPAAPASPRPALRGRSGRSPERDGAGVLVRAMDVAPNARRPQFGVGGRQ